MTSSEMEPCRVDGLYAFKTLIKMGCEWQGDVISRKWAECLIMNEDNIKEVLDYLTAYDNSPIPVYHINGMEVWLM